MPPQINLDAYKDLVLSLYTDNVSLAEICRVLQERHRISITWKTLRRRFEEWGVVTGARTVYRRNKDGELRERVRKFVCEDKLPTKVRFTLHPQLHVMSYVLISVDREYRIENIRNPCK